MLHVLLVVRINIVWYWIGSMLLNALRYTTQCQPLIFCYLFYISGWCFLFLKKWKVSYFETRYCDIMKSNICSEHSCGTASMYIFSLCFSVRYATGPSPSPWPVSMFTAIRKHTNHAKSWAAVVVLEIKYFSPYSVQRPKYSRNGYRLVNSKK